MAGSLLLLYLFANYLLLITRNLLLLPWIIWREYPASIHQAAGFYVAMTLVLKMDPWYWSIYLQGSSGETDIENRLMDMGRGEVRVRCMERINMETYITICKIDSCREFAVWLRKVKRALYQPGGVRWGGRWEGVSKGRGSMYIYGWFMLKFDRKQHNSVKQLSFNWKIKKF